MLMKMTQGVNFTNILREPFCAKLCCAAFSYLQFGSVISWQKNISTKAALGKLTKGANLTNFARQ